MNRDELARELMAATHRKRLERIGEPVPQDSVPFEELPGADQRNWLDLADVVIELCFGAEPVTSTLRSQADDFDRYMRTLIADKSWRNEMLSAMVVEMRVEIDKLARLCDVQ